jgi:hypothetical protein
MTTHIGNVSQDFDDRLLPQSESVSCYALFEKRNNFQKRLFLTFEELFDDLELELVRD